MNKLRAGLVFGAALFLACTSAKVKQNPEAVSDHLFPPGVYHHSVNLNIKLPEAKEKSYQFTGVVRLAENEINVVVLSAFGTTEFKINENLKTGGIKVEIFRENFKKFESKLKDYYSTLRLILLAKAKSSGDKTLFFKKIDSQNRPLEIETAELEPKARFEITDYDKNQIPGMFKIENTHFTVSVKVTSYEI